MLKLVSKSCTSVQLKQTTSAPTDKTHLRRKISNATSLLDLLLLSNHYCKSECKQQPWTHESLSTDDTEATAKHSKMKLYQI